MASSSRSDDLFPVRLPHEERRGLIGRIRHALGGRPDRIDRESALADRLDVVLEVAGRLTRPLERGEILLTIVEEANRALPADGSTIRMIAGDRVELAAWAGISDEVAASLPSLDRDEGWFAELARTARPLAIDDIHTSAVGGLDRYGPTLRFAACLAVPLLQQDRVIGALSCVTHERRAWTADDLEFATTLAMHASIALQTADLFEETVSRARQLAVLQSAAARMNRAKSVEAVGRSIVEETRRVLDYHSARVHVLEPPADLVAIAFEGGVGGSDHVDMERFRTQVGRGFTGWVAERGLPLLIDDVAADPRGEPVPDGVQPDESILVVPMRHDGGVIGVITLSKLGLRQFDEDDLQLLSILADQGATALESARLVARSEGFARELRQLVEMSSDLSASLDPRQVANLIAKHLAGAMVVDECAISYWDRIGGRVLTLGYYPPSRLDELEPHFEIAGFPETVRVLETQATVVIDSDDPAADPAESRLLQREGNRMLAMLPLVAKGQSIGLVELMSKSALRFDEDRLALARTMANEAAMALENARLYDDTRKLADRDPLTGFYNHRYLHERLGEEVVRARRSRKPLSVLMLDVDDFKLVNDTFGHLFGDRVLAWIAERIRLTLRGPDVPARYGGDEFAIILPDTDKPSARRAAERIVETFQRQPFESEARGPVPVAVSIGLATHPTDGRTAPDLIAAADRGLYGVKRSGRRQRAGDRVTDKAPDRAPGRSTKPSARSATDAA
ncbi:MAG TPA: GAF domain-containing protein [Candidatus Limnocylindrales bacterium]|jgi:diguanylate cyclase (GGDEF)-like protein|nr:GAF domain-containing protein [Candidatus Limnocylindrales bacterium]